ADAIEEWLRAEGWNEYGIEVGPRHERRRGVLRIGPCRRHQVGGEGGELFEGRASLGPVQVVHLRGVWELVVLHVARHLTRADDRAVRRRRGRQVEVVGSHRWEVAHGRGGDRHRPWTHAIERVARSDAVPVRGSIVGAEDVDALDWMA